MSQAKREERLAHYQQIIALRKQGFSFRCVLPLDQLFLLHERLSPWRDVTLDMGEFVRVRDSTHGPDLPGLHFNGEHEQGVRT